MNAGAPGFVKPNPIERIFNKAFGILVGFGLGLRHNYLLQVRGRRSSRTYSTPVNLLEFRGRRFLVAPRGRTQWVRNAEAAGQVTLRKAWSHQRFQLRAVPDEQKAEILTAYLDRFKLTVQRYFPVPAGSAPEAFVDLADRYPVFELLPSNDALQQAATAPRRSV